MSKLKAKDPLAPDRGPLASPRFIVALLLMALGIAWTVYYYVVFDPTAFPPSNGGQPAFVRDLGDWNYLIGFGLLLAGLVVSAHPSTPLGRGRGVVVGMLGCFLVGLVWICIYYIFSNDLSSIPIFDDLGQKNLFVGIGFMAVGFTFATRWE